MCRERHCRTPAAGTAGARSLFVCIVDLNPAVGVDAADVIPSSPRQIPENFLPDFSEIAGNNLIVIRHVPSEIRQMAADHVTGGRRHSRSHIHRILDAVIDDLAGRDPRDARLASFFPEHIGATSRDRPRRRFRALVGIFQWKTELLFRAGKMARRHRHNIIRIPRRHAHRAQ